MCALRLCPALPRPPEAKTSSVVAFSLPSLDGPPPPPSRCIGSIQQLKSKFGKDYLLEMKVKTLAQVKPLHSEILRLFPQAARQER